MAKKPKTEITNCHFIGVSWDEQATKAVIAVAEGLLNLTKLFVTQNIHVETMLALNLAEPGKETTREDRAVE